MRSITGNTHTILAHAGRADTMGVEPSQIMVTATNHGWQQVTSR